MRQKRKKIPVGLFIGAFGVLVAFIIVGNLWQPNRLALSVLDNAGVTILETVNNSLVSVFQDGRVAVWNWNELPQQKVDFHVVSDRAIILDTEHLAAMTKVGKKMLMIYNLSDGQKQKEFSVGWEDQEVWLRISPDKRVVALIRRNPPDAKGHALCEFLTVDIERNLLSSSITLSISLDTEDFIDYVVSDTGILYGAGSIESTGRIIAVDLKNGSVLWDTVYDNTKEFCSIIVSPDSASLYAGNRDGFLYEFDAQIGDLLKKRQLLDDDETRPVTNDYSVLNLVFNQDGNILAATITPKAYLLKAKDNKQIFSGPTGAKLTSKIAFSPDGGLFATSDIRAGGAIYINKMPEYSQ